MSRKKKIRKEEVKNLDNVFSEASEFRAQNDAILELGCGYGEYCIELAEKFPEKFFIGVDVKADRLWMAALKAKELSLNNVVFINIHILNLCEFFLGKSVSEIWITFPDPQPKEKNEKHR